MAYVLQMFEHSKWDWNKLVVNGLACYCSCSCTYNPKSQSNRVLFITFLMGCIIFTTTFIAFLTSFANNTFYEKQIASIDEILSENFVLAGDRFTLTKLMDQRKVSHFKIN